MECSLGGPEFLRVPSEGLGVSWGANGRPLGLGIEFWRAFESWGTMWGLQRSLGCSPGGSFCASQPHLSPSQAGGPCSRDPREQREAWGSGNLGGGSREGLEVRGRGHRPQTLLCPCGEVATPRELLHTSPRRTFPPGCSGARRPSGASKGLLPNPSGLIHLTPWGARMGSQDGHHPLGPGGGRGELPGTHPPASWSI